MSFIPILLIIGFLLQVSIPSNNALAQVFEDDPLFQEDENMLGGFEDEFQDSEFGDPAEFSDPDRLPEEEVYDPFDDPGEGEELYIDEDSFDIDTEQALKESLFGQREMMAREKRDSITNIAYGAGTGLLIGAWTAFITSETTTRNQWRTIGTATVLGGVVGLMLGTRSVWDPEAVRPETGSLSPSQNWIVQQELNGFKIAYRWHF